MINRYIRAIAGIFILISLLLAVYVNIHWLWFTAFVGVNLLQSSFSKMVFDGNYSEEVRGA